MTRALVAGVATTIVLGAAATAPGTASPVRPAQPAGAVIESSGPAGGSVAALARGYGREEAYAGVHLVDGRPVLNVAGEEPAARVRRTGVRVRTVAHSLRELRAAARDLADLVAGGGGLAVADISENNVYLYRPADGLDARTREALAGVRAAGIRVRLARPVTTTAAYHGGVGITYADGPRLRSICTGAFNVSNSSGYPMVLTAGHCGRRGTAWYSHDGGYRVGVIRRRTFQGVGDDDWAAVRSSRIYSHPGKLRQGSVYDYRVRRVVGVGRLVEGQRVCRNGRTTNTRCGDVLRVEPGDYVMTDTCARGGDSGGPLFRRIPGTNKVRALGIVSGATADAQCGDSDMVTISQPVREVLNKLDLTLRRS